MPAMPPTNLLAVNRIQGADLSDMASHTLTLIGRVGTAHQSYCRHLPLVTKFITGLNPIVGSAL